MSETNENPALINLTTANKDLRQKMTDILDNLETIDPKILEDQVVEMLQNMMNFFAIYIDQIPNFFSLTDEQQQDLICKFGAVAASLVARKVSSINEMTQIFVFTVLNSLSENINEINHLTLEELLHKKQKNEFRKFLRRAADFELNQILNKKDIGITDSIKSGVQEALKNANLEVSFDKISKSTMQILEEAHKSYKKIRSI
jgi:hypothetical protein